MVVTCVADGIPAYVVKNNCTGKRKVVHWARLLLWLAYYGEPIRCNHVDTSNFPTGTAMDRNPQTGCDGDNSVPGCSLQYSMDLTVYMAVIEDSERMSSRIGREVRAGAPRNVAGQMIIKPDEEECPTAWAPTRKTFHVVEAQALAGTHPVPFNQPKFLGEK